MTAVMRSPVFIGDDEQHLEMLVNACEVRLCPIFAQCACGPNAYTRTSTRTQTRFQRFERNPALYGRQLQPYDFGGPVPEASHSQQRNRTPRTPQPKKQPVHSTRNNKPSSPATRKAYPKQSGSHVTFAGPATSYQSPKPSDIPPPPAFLLTA